MTDVRKAASNAEVESAALVDGLPEQESVSRAPKAPQGDGVVEALRRLDDLFIQGHGAPVTWKRIEQWKAALAEAHAALAPKEGAPAGGDDGDR